MIRGAIIFGVGGFLGYQLKAVYSDPEVKAAVNEIKEVVKNFDPNSQTTTEGESQNEPG